MSYIYKDKSIQEWFHFIRHEEIIEVMKIFPEGENLKILDIGGGDGYIASFFSEKGYEVTPLLIYVQDFHSIFPFGKCRDQSYLFQTKRLI